MEQKLIPKQNPDTSSSDPLEVTHNIEVPQIEKTIELVSQALATKRQRRHHCRICDKAECRHFQRYDVDTLEVFDQGQPPYYDVDAPERPASDNPYITTSKGTIRGKKLGSV